MGEKTFGGHPLPSQIDYHKNGVFSIGNANLTAINRMAELLYLVRRKFPTAEVGTVTTIEKQLLVTITNVTD